MRARESVREKKRKREKEKEKLGMQHTAHETCASMIFFSNFVIISCAVNNQHSRTRHVTFSRMAGVTALACAAGRAAGPAGPRGPCMAAGGAEVVRGMVRRGAALAARGMPNAGAGAAGLVPNGWTCDIIRVWWVSLDQAWRARKIFRPPPPTPQIPLQTYRKSSKCCWRFRGRRQTDLQDMRVSRERFAS